jgi:hypothetical protein
MGESDDDFDLDEIEEIEEGSDERVAEFEEANLQRQQAIESGAGRGEPEPEQPPAPKTPQPKPDMISWSVTGDDSVHRMMRKLYLEQGWGSVRISKYLGIKPDSVHRYIKKHKLDEKKKSGDWTPSDLLMPDEQVRLIIQQAARRETVKRNSASVKGTELAERVAKEVVTREQMAKDFLLKLTGQAEELSERMKASMDHMKESQNGGETNFRDLKDMTAAYLNITRSLRELSGERGAAKANEDKNPPVRIGIIGNVRIGSGGVEVERQSSALDV